MRLLYKIIFVDPEFLPRLKKFCYERGFSKKMIFYIMAALKDPKTPTQPTLAWLRKMHLISDEAYKILMELEAEENEARKQKIHN